MSKHRSRAYPGVTLGMACGLVREKLKEAEGKWLNRQALAALLGYRTGEGGIAARKIAALVHFGFLERSEEGYRLSQKGRRIQELDEGSAEVQQVAQEALTNPVLYNEILIRFQASERVSIPELKQILTSELGITEQARDDATEIFLESARFAGVLNSEGIFVKTNRKRDAPENIPHSTQTSTKRLEILIGKESAFLEFPIDMDSKAMRALESAMPGVLGQVRAFLQLEDDFTPLRGRNTLLFVKNTENSNS
jgi:hypothetical protein